MVRICSRTLARRATYRGRDRVNPRTGSSPRKASYENQRLRAYIPISRPWADILRVPAVPLADFHDVFAAFAVAP